MNKTSTVSHSMSNDKLKSAKDFSAKSSEMLNAVSEPKEEKKVVEEKPKDFGDLKQLVFLGKQTTSVEFGGYTFVMSTLNNTQQKQLVSKLRQVSNEDRGLFLKPYAVASSIVSINDVLVEDLAPSQELSIWDRKLSVVDGWQAVLVDALFFEYETIMAKANEVFIKKELADDIKK